MAEAATALICVDDERHVLLTHSFDGSQFFPKDSKEPALTGESR